VNGKVFFSLKNKAIKRKEKKGNRECLFVCFGVVLCGEATRINCVGCMGWESDNVVFICICIYIYGGVILGGVV